MSILKAVSTESIKKYIFEIDMDDENIVISNGIIANRPTFVIVIFKDNIFDDVDVNTEGFSERSKWYINEAINNRIKIIENN